MNYHDPNPQSWSAIRARLGMESRPVLRIKRVSGRDFVTVVNGSTIYKSPIGPRLLLPSELRQYYRLAYNLPPVGAPDARRPTVREIIAETCAKYGVTKDDLFSHRKTKCLFLPRHEIMWRARHETRLTFAIIAHSLNRNESTVQHGIRKHQARIDARDGLLS